MGPIADAIVHLRRSKVTVERGPMQRFGAKGPGTSVYFRDPDGSLMEFMSWRLTAVRCSLSEYLQLPIKVGPDVADHIAEHFRRQHARIRVQT